MFIYKNYSQEALDRQYNNRSRVPDFDEFLQRWEEQSEAFRQRSLMYGDLAYGPGEREKLDIFPAPSMAPVHVFLHGGYWRSMDKPLFHFVAQRFIDHGVTTVLVTYPLAPQASMDEIVQSCRRALVWLYRHLADYNGDPSRIYISGHSAGGHLVAMLMATDWPALAGDLPPDLIKGGCAISGLFDLAPIQLSYLNEVLGMDEAMARRNSPLLLEPTCASPLIVTVGELESEEFHAQSDDLVAAWSQKGQPISRVPAAGANHFLILEHLTNSEAPLNQAVLQQMGIK